MSIIMTREERLHLLPNEIIAQIMSISMKNLKQELIKEATEKLYYIIHDKEESVELDFNPGWDWCDYDPYGDKDDIITQLEKLKRLDAITDEIISTVLGWLEWANNITGYPENYTGNEADNYRAKFDIYRSVEDEELDEKIRGFDEVIKKPQQAFNTF